MVHKIQILDYYGYISFLKTSFHYNVFIPITGINIIIIPITGINIIIITIIK